MDLLLAIKDSEGFYLAHSGLIDKYARLGYTIYIQHPDGTMEKIQDPIIEEEGGGENS